MITHTQYMQGHGMDNHRKYYAQFVNQAVKNKVIQTIGLAKLLASKDEHLNDIPLHIWDKMGGFVFRVIGGEQRAVIQPRSVEDILPVDYQLLKEANEGISSATMVCIYKEAARQIIESEGNL